MAKRRKKLTREERFEQIVEVYRWAIAPETSTVLGGVSVDDRLLLIRAFRKLLADLDYDVLGAIECPLADDDPEQLELCRY